ncbi:branched-chain amino acid ABC transporter permease [Caenimonas sedimenti]|uniref:Branched-chain amino acid ABC transporter permease n=1 Tax=Caenimonas sedimenti TaxID=2596921 RepID=A0A562ZYD5_9BURK|nr:branched-chain amino acid ABC transporter permease [Caenimonas sedimenti]TWO73335.1 branched-chain amino acid ABC transporter permease [Caenimonas sedimenti]
MIAQAIADGFLNGAIVALGAIGVTFSLAILRFANFSHGDLLAVGAYAALFLLLSIGAPKVPLGPFSFGAGMGVALLAGMIIAIAVSLLLDRLVYQRLRRRGADPLTLVFASFGLALVLRSVLHLLFGPDPFNYSNEIQMALLLPGNVRVLPDQVLVFVVTLVVLGALAWFLQRTRYGVAMRSVAENPMLASVAGIDPVAIVRLTWIVSTALAALAGVFYGMTVQVRPEMGLNLLLPLFTAAILGGVGSVTGAVVGALAISLAESLLTLVMPTSYRPLVPFVLLLLVLYFRPAGLFAAKH